MNQLETALCAYLPHGVKMYREKLESREIDLWTLTPESIPLVLEFGNKMILRPMEDLHGVPMRQIRKELSLSIYEGMELFELLLLKKKPENITVGLSEKLNKAKIDWRGLIASGHAIDVNTLETNPYK